MQKQDVQKEVIEVAKIALAMLAPKCINAIYELHFACTKITKMTIIPFFFVVILY